jgi:hypothetical protein
MIDLEAIKSQLSEYDDAQPRCPQKVARTINCAPDYLTTKHTEYHDYDLTTYSPCCRPEGHEGECRNARPVLGWPGFVTVSALVEEVEQLRSENLKLRDVLEWVNTQCPGKCAGVCDATLRAEHHDKEKQ